MALPFLNSVAQIMPMLGMPSNDGAGTQVITTTAGPTTLTIAAASTTPSAGGTPFNLNGAPPPCGGKIRIRTSAVNASTTTAVTMTVTDGTTTLQVGQIGPTAAGNAIDETTDFRTDLAITSISIAVTLGGSVFTATIDWEVSLNP